RPIAPLVEGWVSPVDGRGDRLVWIVRPQREGGLAVLTAVLNEPAGLRGFARARAAGTSGVGEYPTFRARLFPTDPAPRDPPLAARVMSLPNDTTALV